MSAAVDEGVDRAVRPARDDDRDLADCRRGPIAGFRNLRGEAHIAPGRPLEDAFLFEPVLLGIGIDAEGHLAERVGRKVHAGLEAGILDGHGAPSSLRRFGCRDYALCTLAASIYRRGAAAPRAAL